MPLGSLQSRVIHLDNAVYGAGMFTAPPLYIVWHMTESESALEAIRYLNRVPSDDPASYHYVIDVDGTVYRMTAPDMIAWHAGKSWWPEPVVYDSTKAHQFETRSLNRYSYGVAFANTDTTKASLTREQLSSGWWLAQALMEKAKIPATQNLGHREVAPGRKSDPSPLVLSMAWWREMVRIPTLVSEQWLHNQYLWAHARS